MSAIPQKCLDDLASLRQTLSDDLKQQIQSGLYGGQPCCDTFGADVKIYLSLYIAGKYNPANGRPDVLYPLTDQQIQCLCDWASRHKFAQDAVFPT